MQNFLEVTFFLRYSVPIFTLGKLMYNILTSDYEKNVHSRPKLYSDGFFHSD